MVANARAKLTAKGIDLLVANDVSRRDIGFDAEDRAVVTEEYSGFLGGRLYYETFVRHDAALVEAAHFDTDGPIYLHEYRFEGGLMRSADMVARRGSGLGPSSGAAFFWWMIGASKSAPDSSIRRGPSGV